MTEPSLIGPDAAEPVVLDARGLRCPLPVIKLGTLLREEPSVLEVRLLATDPAARTDVAAFCRMRGHLLVGSSEHRPAGEPAYAAYLVRRGG